MEFSDYLISLLAALAGTGPALLFWIAVIILAAVWRRRGGGRAERFIIAGAAIKIAGNLLGTLVAYILPWSISRGYDVAVAASISSGYGIFLNVISMAGIICLIYAFWVKFREKHIAAAPEVTA